MDDSPLSISKDVAAVAAIRAISPMLKLVCDATGMGFAAVARVTEGTWTACAVQDNIEFGLKAGGQLPVNTTLCIEARAAREPVVFDHASTDPRYKDHHTPRMYNIESYISVPIIFSNGDYFGNLCAIDPKPRSISKVETIAMFTSFADLIAAQLELDRDSQHVASQLFEKQEEGKAREGFIAVLGHDLRSPLSAVAMTAEYLVRLDSGDKVTEAAHRLRSTASRMSKLVDDVLDLARGRMNGDISVSRVVVDNLGELIEDVIEESQAAYPQKSIHARIHIARPVTCDPLRVQQLVSNLVSNAVANASQEYSIAVSAELRGDLLEIAVLHEGEPIPEGMQAKVFDAYWRDAAGGERKGPGLGLFISNQIAKAHGGEIRVDSSAEGGTLFVAELRV